ncbi:Lysophosphatidylcholine acyltransferase [Yarrowia sp. B02]|nr:Lysophosphatidylcholine acyltransferase [Yarrowia sp. B02]
MSFRNVSLRGSQLLGKLDSRGWGWYVAKKWNIGLVYTLCKVFLRSRKVDIRGLDNLLEAQKQARLEGRGLLTVMNHTSVLDDPVVWGMLPNDNGWIPWLMRWATGAKDICYKNRLYSLFFGAGQVLPITRFGLGGPFQPGMDMCVRLLNPNDKIKYSAKYAPYLVHTNATSYPFWRESNWVHFFPEGYVHQALEPHEGTMRYFRWGTSRAVLEPVTPPIIVPMYSHGLQKVFQEIPKGYEMEGNNSNADRTISIRIGEPISENTVAGFRNEWIKLCEKEGASLNDETMPESLKTGKEAQELRSRVASRLREHVEELRMSVPQMNPELPEFKEPEFWNDIDKVHKGVYNHRGKVRMLRNPTQGLIEVVEAKEEN